MVITEYVLYVLARLLSRSELAHSSDMKNAMRNTAANDAYRAGRVDCILAAARKLGVEVAGRDLLDLGCGDGALTIQYATRGPRSVIGVDIDADAVARAQASRHDRRVLYRVSSTTRLPLPDASIDVILCYDVFEHVAQPSAILSECRRVLRPGGQMLIGTWGWRHPFAPHLWSTMPVPWAHVIASEKTLLRACRRVYQAPWYTPTFHDFDTQGQRLPDRYNSQSISTAYLNKYLVRDFERVFADSGLQWRLELVPFGSRWAIWTRPLLRTRYFREFLHGYLWGLLVKPG